jgi:hypothetical protein
MIKVLREARKPLKAAEIAKRVLDRKLAPGLKGATPKQTLLAILATENARSGKFIRTAPGTYKLRAKPKAKAKPKKESAPTAA